jgi:hypothetical protein
MHDETWSCGPAASVAVFCRMTPGQQIEEGLIAQAFCRAWPFPGEASYRKVWSASHVLSVSLMGGMKWPAAYSYEFVASN